MYGDGGEVGAVVVVADLDLSKGGAANEGCSAESDEDGGESSALGVGDASGIDGGEEALEGPGDDEVGGADE